MEATTYKSVYSPVVSKLAYVAYEDRLLAEIGEGETLVLKCKGKTMEGDIVISLGERPVYLQEKTATANGEVVPDEGYDGLSKVIVNIPD